MLPSELALEQDRASDSDYNKAGDEQPFGSSMPPVAEVMIGFPFPASSSTSASGPLHGTLAYTALLRVALSAVTSKHQPLGASHNRSLFLAHSPKHN